MQTIGELELYETIDEMPIIRKHLFDKYLIMDSGMGKSLADVEQKHQRLHVFLAEKKFDKALQEAKNLHHTIFNGLSMIDFKSLSFSCLVKSIKGDSVSVNTESEAESVLEEVLKMQEITSGELETYVLDIKKKILKSLGYTFQGDT